jgi:predicted O-linked N-acetylglucosamine transferase (SPINDLY family)
MVSWANRRTGVWLWVWVPYLLHGLGYILGGNEGVSGGIIAGQSSAEIRAYAIGMFDAGRHADMLAYLNEVEQLLGNLAIDNTVPSLYSYRGVALAGHSGSNNRGAVEAFKNATAFYPDDAKSWMNLGEASMYIYDMDVAENAFLRAQSLGSVEASARLLAVKAWILSWKDFEVLTATLEVRVNACFNILPHAARWNQPVDFNFSSCVIDNTQGLEYTDVSSAARAYFYALSPNSKQALIPLTERAGLWKSARIPSDGLNRRLKVGILSSDFGIHPVASLIRGFVQFINATDIELFCFSVSPQISWWSGNISGTLEPNHFVGLNGMNAEDGAKLIANLGIEILIDLNGHTIKSGLPVMAFRPAPVQITYLGWPITTAASYIDYYLGDWVVNAAEYTGGYFERLLLMPPCYISNDYAQMQGYNMYLTGEHRAPRSVLEASSTSDLDAATILFSTFSNGVKWEPTVFTVWMNILHRCPGSKMIFLKYEEMKYGYPRLHDQYGPYHGISQKRLAIGNVVPWIDHLYVKTAVDMNLDTISKNGHTTGLDAAWSGVPTVSLVGGQHGPTRAGESIAEALYSGSRSGTGLGLVQSLKDYEDLVSVICDDSWSRRLQEAYRKYSSTGISGQAKRFTSTLSHVNLQGRSPWRLRILRDLVEQQRFKGTLFDTPGWTKNFESMMLATWEVAHIAPSTKKYHIFAAAVPKPKNGPLSNIRAYHTFDSAIGMREWYPTQRVRDQFMQRFGFDIGLPVSKYVASGVSSLGTTTPTAEGPTVGADSAVPRKDKYHLTKRCGELDIYPVDPRPLINANTVLHIGSVPEQERGSHKNWVSVSSSSVPGTVIGVHDAAAVDIVRYMHDLLGIPDESVGAIYASHVLEHNSYGDGMLDTAIAGTPHL